MANVLGVKYLKISKTDANGDDRSEVLRQLTNIRLKYSDIGVKQYNIQTIQELSTYFLFGINYQDIASPNDKGIYDYQTQAIQVGGYLVDSTDGVVPVQGYTNTIANSRFDVGAGTFQLGTTTAEHNPNAVLQITASVNYAPIPPTATPSPILSIVDAGTSNVILSVSSASVTSPGTLILTASITDTSPLWNQLVNLRGGLQLGLQNEATDLVQFTNITLTVTQSQAFTNTSSILTVPSPNNIKKFESTDCDVTYGFVDQYPISQYYMDIDYSSGITVPINQQQLVSGTAVLAPVKDYYYYLQSQTNPRYQGSRVSQLELNKYTGPSSTYVGDIAYGKSPNIELNRAYFAWFTEVYGASPEYNDAVNVNIKYLVDELGNTYTPGLTRYFEDELIATFTQGEAAELNFVDAVGGTNSTPTAIKAALNGERAIIRPGVKASAVLYSQTGSSVGAYTQSLQFTTIENGSAYKTLTDYRFGAQQYGVQIIPAGTGYTQVTFATENWDFANGYDTGTSRYTFSSTPQSRIRFKINLGDLFTSDTEDFNIILKKNGTTDLYTKTIKYGGGSILNDFTITTDYYNFQSGDYLEVLIQQVPSYIINLSKNGTARGWLAEQELLTQQTLPSITAPFFFTSSTDPYILTASLQFSSSINQVYQVGLSGSGFDPVRYKASFEPGDQFRFENNELNVYTINKIISSSTAQGSNGQTVLLLDQPITNGTNVDYFVLRRFAPDPSNVIIQGIKPSGGTGAGTLKPIYITDNLNTNMANIVSKLNSENAI